ncbi:hypothetical protein HIMB11_02189 [Rhodobacteraceae bacterium HIMB11]|nr:hypothetical protein HIMB11_02189 [Rhodobacteraceae bacterium HIMB11]
MDVIGIFALVAIAYYWSDREAKKPVKAHEDLANQIFDEKDAQGLPPSDVYLQLHQNLNAARTQRAVRNIETMVLLFIVLFLLDAIGLAFWN